MSMCQLCVLIFLTWLSDFSFHLRLGVSLEWCLPLTGIICLHSPISRNRSEVIPSRSSLMGIVQVQPSAGANFFYPCSIQRGDRGDVSVEHHLAMWLMESPKENVISLVVLCPFKGPLRLSEWHEGPSRTRQCFSLCDSAGTPSQPVCLPYKVIYFFFFKKKIPKWKNPTQHSGL